MSEDFEDIRPYTNLEIPDAMQRIAQSEYLPKAARFIYPDMSVDEVRAKIAAIRTIDEFQATVMYDGLKRIMATTITNFTYEGSENLSKERGHVFVSNHRDIVMDAYLMQGICYQNDYDLFKITFGANLMENPLIREIGKSNKMFHTARSGTPKSFYQNMMHMSQYIRYSLMEEHDSVWIAQRNGRTKDGLDATDPAVVKMLGMSGGEDYVKSVDDLSIIPLSVSYEWEPCDILKAVELCKTRHGAYEKKPGEDVNSILTGIVSPKGCVHISVCKPLQLSELEPIAEPRAEFFKKTAAIIDQRIAEGYMLHPTNYIAHDIRSATDTYCGYYTQEQKQKFLDRVKLLPDMGEDNEVLREIFISIYANPIDTKIKAGLL